MNTDLSPSIVTQPNVVGVVGGGQLALMLLEAAQKRNIETIVQTSSKQDPAARRSGSIVIASPEDIDGTKKLVNSCSCVTFENEWVNIEGLSNLEEIKGKFMPTLQSLKPLLDKLSQRKLLSELKIPGPKWLILNSNQLSGKKLPSGWRFPVMAKSISGGYDGKGTRVINNLGDLKELMRLVKLDDWIIESWVKYDQELAIVATRDKKGKVRTFPLVETHQVNQVCDWVLAPAEVPHNVQVMAYNIASSLLTQLNYVGIIAIEFFYGPEGLLVNEIAPRTHNSAHYSIEACNSSQFDQQICLASDLIAPPPELIVPGAVMVNLLGLPSGMAPSLEQRLDALGECEGIHLHWYDKESETPGRKLGHVTVILKGTSPIVRRVEALNALNKIRSIWPMIKS